MMDTQNKKALIVRFLYLLEKSGYGFSEETQKYWQTANFDEQILVIKKLAINEKNLSAAKALLEFSQSLDERMDLQQVFMSSDEYKDKTYCFKKDKVENKTAEILSEIVSLGGQFVEPSQNSFNDYFYASVGFVNQFVAWEFHRKYRDGEYYNYSKHYEDELSEIKITNAINEGVFTWDYQSVKDLFHSSGYYRSRGSLEDWVMMAALLRSGMLDVSVEECTIPHMPDFNRDDFFWKQYIEAVSITRGDSQRGLLAYCAWYWLHQMGGDDADFSTSLYNVGSEHLGIYIKIGDADPYQLIKFILSENTTYVHMPYFTTPTLIVVKPNKQYMGYMNGDESLYSSLNHEVERVFEIEKEREEQHAENRQQQYYNSCQLNNYNDSDIFIISQIEGIFNNDQTSPFKKEKISTQLIRNWIKSGELPGFKLTDDKRWRVKKEDILAFFKRKREE